MSPRTIRAVQLATLIVALLSLAAGGWLLWRARSYESDPIFREDGQGGLSRELIPNLRAARVVVPERPHRPEEARSTSGRSTIGRRRSFTLTTERHGFRADADVSDIPAGRRVLVVGDSVALGWGVEQPDSFPARLAASLGVEVVNAGIPGLQPPDVAERAVRLAAQLKPDLVVLAKRPRPGSDDVRHLCEGARRLGSTRSAIVFHPVSTFDVGETGASPPVPPDCAAPTLDLTAAFRAALPLPGVVLERQGAEQVVLRLPARTELLRVRPKDPRQLADEVVQAFEADRSVNEPLFYDGGHPDAAGFVLYADTVAAFLREKGLVP
jgi:hypothetical protein